MKKIIEKLETAIENVGNNSPIAIGFCIVLGVVWASAVIVTGAGFARND